MEADALICSPGKYYGYRLISFSRRLCKIIFLQLKCIQLRNEIVHLNLNIKCRKSRRQEILAKCIFICLCD